MDKISLFKSDIKNVSSKLLGLEKISKYENNIDTNTKSLNNIIEGDIGESYTVSDYDNNIKISNDNNKSLNSKLAFAKTFLKDYLFNNPNNEASKCFLYLMEFYKNYIYKLKETIKKHANTITILNSKRYNYKLKINELIKDNDSITKNTQLKIDEQLQLVIDKNNEISLLKQKNDNLEKENNNLKIKLQAFEASNNNKNLENEIISNLHDSKYKLEYLYMENRKLSEINGELKAKNSALKNENTALITENKELKEHNMTYKIKEDNYSSLENDYKELKNENYLLKDQNNKLFKTNEKLIDEICKFKIDNNIRDSKRYTISDNFTPNNDIIIENIKLNNSDNNNESPAKNIENIKITEKKDYNSPVKKDILSFPSHDNIERNKKEISKLETNLNNLLKQKNELQSELCRIPSNPKKISVRERAFEIENKLDTIEFEISETKKKLKKFTY